MASISPLSFLSTINVSAANASSSLFPSAQKPRKSTNPKRQHAAKVACNATQNNLPTNPEGENIIQGNRRDVLVGLGGLGAATFACNAFATAAPVAPGACCRPILPHGVKPTRCCPPSSSKVIDFVFPPNQPLRRRQPTHKLSDESLTKYKQAVLAMKALQPDDPLNFTQQANVHCAYCHYSYQQLGFPSRDLQIHFSWLFLPWHRWYLYFFERILGSLIDDPTFALPFWNWDHPDGMEMPSIFTDRESPLYDPLRNANHQPPVLIDLNWNKCPCPYDVCTNLNLMYRNVYEAKGQEQFFGKPFRAGDKDDSKHGPGSLELAPHNTVHNWTGGLKGNGEDMGIFYSAARDPIFYSHHANVDRMWNIWKQFGRKDINDQDYLNSSFLFYDENRNQVRVTVKDALDTEKLGYDYQYVEIPWAKTKPLPRRTKVQRLAEAQRRAEPLQTVRLPLTLLKNIVSTVVKRPKISRSKKEKEEEEETLVIEIEFDRSKAVKFDVLINEEEDALLATPRNREFVGSFVNVSHSQNPTEMETASTFSIGITDVLDDLEADNDDNIRVTLVPQYGDAVIIKDINIEYVQNVI